MARFGRAATDVYRQELAAGLPQVNEDSFWMPALAEASAFWFLMQGVSDLGPALEADELWGTATMAQRLVQRSSRFAVLAREAGILPALADVAEQSSEVVRARWLDWATCPPTRRLPGPGKCCCWARLVAPRPLSALHPPRPLIRARGRRSGSQGFAPGCRQHRSAT